MALFNRNKKEELPTIDIPKPKEYDDVAPEEVKAIQQSLLSREEVKIYLAAEEGKKLFEIAIRLNKEQR